MSGMIQTPSFRCSECAFSCKYIRASCEFITPLSAPPPLSCLLQQVDMSVAMNITPVITLAYDTNSATDWADLGEWQVLLLLHSRGCVPLPRSCRFFLSTFSLCRTPF